MPELVEVEAYRRLADGVVGRTVAEVVAPDAWYLKRGLDGATAEAVLTGATVVGTRRIGKLLLLDLDGERPVLGLRFGMSGRLVVDGHAGVDELIYAPRLALDKWDRFGLRFEDGGELRMQDPRRLGGVELDPPEARLGPDALAVTPRGWPPPSATGGARRRSRLGSWTSPALPEWGTWPPTSSSGGPASTRPSRRRPERQRAAPPPPPPAGDHGRPHGPGRLPRRRPHGRAPGGRRLPKDGTP